MKKGKGWKKEEVEMTKIITLFFLLLTEGIYYYGLESDATPVRWWRACTRQSAPAYHNALFHSSDFPNSPSTPREDIGASKAKKGTGSLDI